MNLSIRSQYTTQEALSFCRNFDWFRSNKSLTMISLYKKYKVPFCFEL